MFSLICLVAFFEGDDLRIHKKYTQTPTKIATNRVTIKSDASNTPNILLTPHDGKLENPKNVTLGQTVALSNGSFGPGNQDRNILHFNPGFGDSGTETTT